MASSAPPPLHPTPLPRWVDTPPTPFSIVTAYYPETNPKGALRLRPCLVKAVVEYEDGEKGCLVYFGTKHLKVFKRQGWDVIVQNAGDIAQFGLAMATRFDLDSEEPLPWHPDFFGCWRGKPTLRLGELSADYITEYLWAMNRRGSV